MEKKAWGTRNGGIDAKEKPQKSKLTSEMMICKESPVFCSQRSTATTSTVTDESIANEEETIVLKKSDPKKVSGERNGSGNDEESGRPSVSSTTSSSSYIKGKSYSSARASNVLRNLMKCGGLDTNDAVLVPLSKSRSGAFGVAWEDERRYQYHQQHNARYAPKYSLLLFLFDKIKHNLFLLLLNYKNSLIIIAINATYD